MATSTVEYKRNETADGLGLRGRDFENKTVNPVESISWQRNQRAVTVQQLGIKSVTMVCIQE